MEDHRDGGQSRDIIELGKGLRGGWSQIQGLCPTAFFFHSQILVFALRVSLLDPRGGLPRV